MPVKHSRLLVHKLQLVVKIFGNDCLNADLDSKIFAYDYCAQLAYIMTFNHLHAHNFHSQHPQCVVRMLWV